MMNPAIDTALKDWRIMNSSPSFWATFEAMITEGGQVIVRLEYGVIHTNGQKERSLRIAHYSLDREGKVVVT